MTVRFRDLSASEYWNLTWPFALALLCGIVLRVSGLGPWHGIPSDLFNALGDALVIAGI